MLSSRKGKATVQEWSSRKASDRWRKRDSQRSGQRLKEAGTREVFWKLLEEGVS